MARKLQADEWLFAATVALALFGVIMVYSASAVVAGGENHSQYHYVARQGVWTVAGLAAMLAGMRLDYRVLKGGGVAYGLLALTVVLLVAVFAFPPINGARRWIRFAGFSLQPSELAKLALCVFLARFLERRAGEEGNFWRTFAPAVAVAGLLALLVVAEPDLGTAMMLVVICMTVLFTAGARLRHMALAAAPALAAVAGLLLFVPWRLSLPFFKETALRDITQIGPWLYLPFIAIVLLGFSNAVNLTDGLDGLAISVTVITMSTLTAFTYVSGDERWARYLGLEHQREIGELTVFCGAMVGASLGFLWFNAPPAEVFMGDVGSLAIGGAVGTIGVLTKQEFILVLVGGVYVIEALSVTLQVISFKMTKRRIFKMAPLHHHFEIQWERRFGQRTVEPKVVFRFLIVAILFALLSLSTLKLR